MTNVGDEGGRVEGKACAWSMDPDPGKVFAREPMPDGTEYRVSVHQHDGNRCRHTGFWRCDAAGTWAPVPGKVTTMDAAAMDAVREKALLAALWRGAPVEVRDEIRPGLPRWAREAADAGERLEQLGSAPQRSGCGHEPVFRRGVCRSCYRKLSAEGVPVGGDGRARAGRQRRLAARHRALWNSVVRDVLPMLLLLMMSEPAKT